MISHANRVVVFNILLLTIYKNHHIKYGTFFSSFFQTKTNKTV